MERFLMGHLVEWKDSVRRKPLVVNGARQVGKTWLLQEFGKRHFGNVAYVNLDRNVRMKSQFEAGFDTKRLLRAIEIESGQHIVPGKTLVILDEIQDCPLALTALKYFCENEPNQAIAVAGSLLGITFHSGSGYPVGKVNTLDLHPLSFREFLDATNNRALRELVDESDEVLLRGFASKLVSLLRQYYFVGGMPEAVATYLETTDFGQVRQVQHDILQGYERDMSKHLNGFQIDNALDLWHSIPAHLGRENKKFIFGQIREGARAKSYRFAVTWLTQAGLTHRVSRVKKPGIPLAGYADTAAFKLFLVDVGLLGAMSDLDASSIIDGNRVFTEFKGALTEQFVCQELICENGEQVYYWSAENSRGEIDFLTQQGSKVYAIEVKAEENLRSRSLRAFSERYPQASQARRFSLSDFRDQDWMRNIPLYAIGNPQIWK
ncbi:ATP-binding protein [Mobiluncus mulieris]|uniref:ATP-binding protein n=2 Tax=Mobiluncus mulieris TaxID=2052 RepID=A0A7Y0YGU1_9ACTO|nr:ATP-binding protein [Mobiluncus mulieris]EFN92248.1 hypothetical protein HMPREF9278_1879 [Mobiluncus mulieris FB024-16]MBB5846470.1 putative AAA+ superfamily ATPase [Mobiluncus mulieris]MCV0012378.1 ATP-binding protein [Mobiluncus mulieris]NMX02381.1 ATP-binding protein [Mobiluncus mulieris]NMX11542.1 ATP-binding protein [Mobiluncus mulieris]